MGTLFYDQKRAGEALRWYQEALAAGAPEALNYRAVGDAYRHLGNQRKSREAYRAGLALAEADLTRNPRQGDVRALLGVMAVFTGDSRRAQLEASQAMALYPDDEMVVTDAIIVWEALGKREKSLEILQRASHSLLRSLSRNPDVRDLPRDPRFIGMLSDKTREK